MIPEPWTALSATILAPISDHRTGHSLDANHNTCWRSSLFAPQVASGWKKCRCRGARGSDSLRAPRLHLSGLVEQQAWRGCTHVQCRPMALLGSTQGATPRVRRPRTSDSRPGQRPKDRKYEFDAESWRPLLCGWINCSTTECRGPDYLGYRTWAEGPNGSPHGDQPLGVR